MTVDACQHRFVFQHRFVLDAFNVTCVVVCVVCGVRGQHSVFTSPRVWQASLR